MDLDKNLGKIYKALHYQMQEQQSLCDEVYITRISCACGIQQVCLWFGYESRTYYTLCNYDCCKEVTIRLQYASTAAQKKEGTLRDA